jgi:pimeloyl-ACP methyl ester carboxylesterase
MQKRNFEMIQTNGVTLRCVVEGSGPLVVLLHGFPQCWYLWRHQIDPIARAGFRVAVPDQRGYGGSEAPEAIEAYNIVDLSADVAGIADALGEERFIVVGHDWGAPVAWHTALLHEARVRAVAGLSVPYMRGGVPKMMTRQEFWGDRFWYIVYFQTPGVAEAELEADLRRSLRLIYLSASADAAADVLVKKPKTAGFLDGMVDVDPLPAWLSEEDLDYYVEQYRNNGFRGPVSWYRNIERNHEITPQLDGKKIAQPAFFLAGSEDPVLKFPGDMFNAMDAHFVDLRGKHLVEGAGHWLQLERPAEVTERLVGFLKSVS